MGKRKTKKGVGFRPNSDESLYYHPITGLPLPMVMRERQYRRQPPCPKKDFYYVWEAAVYLGLSRQAVVSRINHGTLRAIRKGKLWLIPYADLKRAKSRSDRTTLTNLVAYHRSRSKGGGDV